MTAIPDIQVEQLSKFYGKRRGVVDFSASIPHGSLVGLLGPNGAGKSTTIRVLSCYTPPTSGRASVCGFDVFSQSLEVRKRLGYLPENCPLYGEMRVMEYLRWTAAMKGLSGSDIDRAIFDAIGPCGIDQVRTQLIGTLSKGYRQRVGLAAALLHRPQVLILDEPTIGLDPLQLREFRALIGSLKGEHTVLISSHILSEIEIICDSVIILNEGRVIADGSPEDLRRDVASCFVVECRIHPSLVVLLPQLINRIRGVTLEHYEEAEGVARFRLRADGVDPRQEIFRFLVGAGIDILEMARERITLEDVFVQHIKNAVKPIRGTALSAPETLS